MLIGFALLAVIGGIIATLITGGSFFPLAPNQRVTASAPPPRLAPAAANNTLGEAASASTPGTSALGEDTAGALVVQDPLSGESNLAESSEPSIAVLPPLPVEPDESSTSVATAAPQETQPDTADGAALASTTFGLPSASSLPEVQAEGAYRISVGAFGSAGNAAKQAEFFRAEGYPVFTGSQGNLSLVLVGPYESEAEATGVAQRISSAGYGVEPIVYRFTGDTDTAIASVEPATSPTTTPSVAGQLSTTTPPVPAGSGRFLQVGAYGSEASSSPQRERLEGFGYQVTQRQEGGYIKLLLGPYGDNDLRAVQSQLEARGIESFAR
jgi:cell division septation protein DedD